MDEQQLCSARRRALEGLRVRGDRGRDQLDTLGARNLQAVDAVVLEALGLEELIGSGEDVRCSSGNQARLTPGPHLRSGHDLPTSSEAMDRARLRRSMRRLVLAHARRSLSLGLLFAAGVRVRGDERADAARARSFERASERTAEHRIRTPRSGILGDDQIRPGERPDGDGHAELARARGGQAPLLPRTARARERKRERERSERVLARSMANTPSCSATPTSRKNRTRRRARPK